MTQPKWYASFKVQARKLAPSRGARYLMIYLPVFSVVTCLALVSVGGVDDLLAYALELAPKSMHVLAAIGLTYGVATGMGWNLDNAKRSDYQRVLIASNGKNFGAFAVLAGEMVSVLALYWITLRALTVWQG